MLDDLVNIINAEAAVRGVAGTDAVDKLRKLFIRHEAELSGLRVELHMARVELGEDVEDDEDIPSAAWTTGGEG